MSETVQRPNQEVGTRMVPNHASPSSGLERFFDNFFREENIKWMSVIGATIVLGSSLMLVSHQWKSWPAEIKYLAIFGYTVGAYGCAQLARFRFGLRTTGNVLHLLTLLLIPLCFMALGWLQTGETNLWTIAETIGLMLPAVAFMRYAAVRIFDDLLRGRQTTFAYSYMVLSIASVLPAFDNVALAGTFFVACWLVMSVGVMKVNRHIFWMTEEHKQPRVFAFFPIALLGAQFLVLVAMKAVGAIPSEWLGMGCVMVSATVLLTARTVAAVFKQRTGDLVRPLPWNLVVPLLIGLAVLVTGVAVSFYGFSFHGPTTFALVPTALVAGVLLCMVAWDTGISGFVWAALVLLTLAYQSSPTLVAGLIQQVKLHAASAVNEASLPIAFYGITYLPLIVVMTLASRCCDLPGRYSHPRLKVFSAPLRRFATLLTAALFALATFNLKSLAIVSILDVPLLVGMAILFKDRRYAYGGLGCLVLASALVVPLISAIGVAPVSPSHTLTAIAALALFLVATPGIDRGLVRIPMPSGKNRTSPNNRPAGNLAICMTVGYGLALSLACGWTVAALPAWPNLPTGATVQFILVLGALLITTLRTRDYLSAISFWIFGGVGAMVALAQADLSWSVLLSACSIAAAAVSLAGYLAIQSLRRRNPQETWTDLRQISATNYALSPRASDAMLHAGLKDRISGQAQLAATLVVSLSDLSLAIAVYLTAFFHIPALAVANFTAQPLLLPVATSVMMVWGTVLAGLFRSRAAGAIAGGVMPLWGCAVLITYAASSMSFPIQTLVWMIFAGCTALIASYRTDRPWLAACAAGQVWAAALTLLSLFNADPIFRVVGLLGLTVGYVLHARGTDRKGATIVAILASLHLFMWVISLSGVGGWFHQQLLSPQLPAAIVTLLPVIGLCTLLFDTRLLPLDRELCTVWSSCLRSLTLAIIIPTFVLGRELTFLLPVIVAGFVIIAIAEFVQAVRHQVGMFVWFGLSALSAAGLWLAQVGVIELGMGISQLGLGIAAAVGLLLAHLLSGAPRYGVFARPMLCIGLACPTLLTGMAIVRELSSPAVTLDPLSTLTMFGAAAVYFHQGLVRKQRGYLLLAVGIINVALMLTWRSLHIYDAQAYCIPIGLSIIAIVQLLKRELPKAAHDPLRYAGALVMLVSPMFAIVGGSWWHLFTLLGLCVCVILLAIGLRLRALVHTGTAFLLADLVMMVVRSSIDHPSLLWICGLGLGGAVIALAAICERHREEVLSRIRMLTAELATWN